MPDLTPVLRALYVLVFAATAGCASGEAPVGAKQAPSGAHPSLGEWVRVPLGAAADSLLWRSVRNVAVTGSGDVLILGDFATDTDDGLLGNIIRPGADTIVRFGRAGEGPGEFSGLNIAIGETDGFSVVSLGRQVLVQVDSRGALRAEHRVELFTSALLATSAQGIDVQSLRPAQSADAPVVARHEAEREPRVLLTAADIASASPAEGPPRTRSLLPYATTRRGDRIAFMLPGGYRIEERNLASGEVRRIERDVEAPMRLPDELVAMRRSLELSLEGAGGNRARAGDLRARLDTLDRERLPHLVWPGLFFDQHDRLWAVGRTGDSTFVDAFVEGAFVTRQVLPCRAAGQRVSLVGEWLALVCDRPEREDAPFEVQLWRRVVE
jgi:hypothetical protein